MCGVWEAVAIKPDMCECVTTLMHTFWEYGNEGMTLLNSCQVIKSLALFGNMWQTMIKLFFWSFFISPDEDILFEVETS